MTPRLSILTILLITGAALSPARVTGKPREVVGSYSVAVAGAFKGSGTGDVAKNKLTVTAQVTDLKGVKGSLSFTAQIRGSHFSVPGTVLGQAAQFTGRLDAPDEINERAIKGVRLTCTFKTAGGQYGKIMAWIPNDTRYPNDDPRGKGYGGPPPKSKDKGKDKGKSK